MSAQHRRSPRRPELSQHFLRSGALASSLVAQTRVSERDLVLEIGPGHGALTRELARRCRRVMAVELDSRLCRLLRDRFMDEGHVAIVHGDFLHFDLPSEAYKVVANIPFSRTSDIIRRLLEARTPPTDAYLVTQREAAHRFVGSPYAQESLSSLLLKPRWHVEIARQLRRSDFEPPPKVETVVLWLARRTRPLLPDDEFATYHDFLERCFGQGGNTIRQCLRSTFTASQIRRLSNDLRFSQEARPSLLTFDQWLGLFRFHALP